MIPKTFKNPSAEIEESIRRGWKKCPESFKNPSGDFQKSIVRDWKMSKRFAKETKFLKNSTPAKAPPKNSENFCARRGGALAAATQSSWPILIFPNLAPKITKVEN